MRGSVSAGFFISAADAMTKTDIANLALSKIGETLIDDIDYTGDRRARLAKLHYEPTLREILRAHFWGFAMSAVNCDPSELLAITIEAPNLPGGKQMLLYAGISGGKAMFSTDGRLMIDGDTAFPWAAAFWDEAEPWWVVRSDQNIDGTSYVEWNSVEDVDTPIDVVTWSEGGGGGAGGGSLSVKVGWPVVMPEVYAGWQSGWKIPADFIKLRKLLTSDGGKIEDFDLRRIGGTRCIVSRGYSSIIMDYVQYVDDPPDYDPLFTAAFVTLLASRLARAISGSDKLEGDLRSLYETVDLPAARTADGYDSQSNENRPLREFLDGSLTGGRGEFFPDLES